MADQIRRRILLGELKGGTRLESGAAMARSAKVTISVIREALAQLRGEGLVRIRHGVGVFVVAKPRRAKMIRAARRTAGRRELTQLRMALEPMAAGAAATRATNARVLELRLLLGERDLARHTGDARRFAETDIALHRAVFRMSGNQLAATSVELAAPMLTGEFEARAEVLATDVHLQGLHGRLVDAIEMGRVTTARRAALAIAEREGHQSRQPP
ncbi:MAG TPA: FCD domain-containing protein [Candidatus Limnocylindrales bacterium]|nr:FCD domain-containing protein [Candidatus Limnocylindrales bacterium]